MLKNISEYEGITIKPSNRDENKFNKKNGKQPEPVNANPRKDDASDDEFEFEDSIVVITDEQGRDIEFCVLDELTHKSSRYLLVIETDILDDDEAEAVIIKEVGEDEDDMVYEELTDEEFEEVAKLFDSRLEDYDVEF